MTTPHPAQMPRQDAFVTIGYADSPMMKWLVCGILQDADIPFVTPNGNELLLWHVTGVSVWQIPFRVHMRYVPQAIELLEGLDGFSLDI